jgi:signal transduction histidine kinase
MLRAQQREAATWRRLLGGAQWRTDARLCIVEATGPGNADLPIDLPGWAGRRLPDLLVDGGDATEAPLVRLLEAHGEVSRRVVSLAQAAQTRLELVATPLFDDVGAFDGYVGALRPLPAHGASAGEREDAASFSFTVSHDLRAPLRVVEGFTRILKEDYGHGIDRVGNDHLDRVLGAAARMNQMIDALLAMARLATQPLARQPVDLSQLASFVADELRRGAPERTIEIQVEPGMIVQGDPTLLRQALENLIGNAWKYTQRSRTPLIEVGSGLVDGRRSFFVRDNGAGFDMRAVDRLFGLFQRLHSASEFPGTGVGLASVKRIVNRHGGRIWAEAEPGRGATFHFTLRD